MTSINPSCRTNTNSCDESAVSAVVVTYNIGERIHKCVDSVRAQVNEIIIVDNGSDERTLCELDELARFSSIRIIRNPRNEGIAHALNQGIKWAIAKGYKWVLTLDHDSEAEPRMVEKLLRVYDRFGGEAGIVAACPFDRNGQVFIRGDILNEYDGNVAEVKETLSSGSLFHVEVFERLGFFNESLFVYYVDTEFCLRVREYGLKVYMCSEAILLHSEGSKENRRLLWRQVFYDRYRKEARYYITRNTIYMLRKYYRNLPFCYGIIRRLLVDHVKVVLYDKEWLSKTVFSLRGLSDGIRGKYGGLNPPRLKRGKD